MAQRHALEDTYMYSHQHRHRDNVIIPSWPLQMDFGEISSSQSIQGCKDHVNGTTALAHVNSVTAMDVGTIDLERARTQTQLTQPRGELSVLMSAENQFNPITQPRDDRNSISTASTASTSLTSARTSRTSMTSMTSTYTPPVDVETWAGSLSRATPRRQKTYTYFCPICNMGPGHATRVYSKKDTIAPNRTVIPGPPGPKKDAQWDDLAAFKNHMLEHHSDIFKRINSSEYTCSYCKCETVLGNRICPGRFHTPEDLVDHLGEVHSRGPRRLEWTPHQCAPINLWSYPIRVREEALRRFPSMPA